MTFRKITHWDENKPGHCTFISGDTRSPNWAYCNEPVHKPGGSWCPQHHAICYEKQKKSATRITTSNLAWSSRTTPLMISQIMPKDFE